MRNKLKLLIYLTASLSIINISTTALAGEKAELTATASSIYSPYYAPSRAVDGNFGTFWVGARDSAPWWIAVDVGRVAYLEEIRFGWYYLYYGTNFDIQVSEDGTTWRDVHTGLIGGYSKTASSLKSYELLESARYVRIYIHSVYQYFPIIPEIEVYIKKVIPGEMRFQGRLKNNTDTDADGSFAITFKIYDTETGGTPLWSETRTNILIEKGVLDIVLGEVNKIALPFDKQYYLGIEVEQDGEMTPRFKLTTVPYSFNSAGGK